MSPDQTTVPRLLLTRAQLAAACQCSVRNTHHLIDKGILPRPIELGPRCQRWDSREVAEALAKAPRAEKSAEPAGLLRERIERQRQTGFPA